jgi:hypothetical protein
LPIATLAPYVIMRNMCSNVSSPPPPPNSHTHTHTHTKTQDMCADVNSPTSYATPPPHTHTHVCVQISTAQRHTHTIRTQHAHNTLATYGIRLFGMPAGSSPILPLGCAPHTHQQLNVIRTQNAHKTHTIRTQHAHNTHTIRTQYLGCAPHGLK